jgi:hypothetical protein
MERTVQAMEKDYPVEVSYEFVDASHAIGTMA